MKTPLLIGISLSLLLSCAGERGRIMTDDEDDYVGNRTAGSATFDRLIGESVEKLLRSHSAARGGLSRLKIAVLSVENLSAEELGDWQEQIYSLITTSVNQSDRYDMISERFVSSALREGRLRADDLFKPAQRRTFMAILESQGQPVDAFLYPKLTSGSTGAGGGTRQRDYTLQLELVDLNTGRTEMVAETIRKEYVR